MNDKKLELVAFRLTTQEKTLLLNAAEKDGRTLANYLRQLVKKALQETN
ncbi:plasmid mobilization protein [Deinococcus radiomollis]